MALGRFGMRFAHCSFPPSGYPTDCRDVSAQECLRLLKRYFILQKALTIFGERIGKQVSILSLALHVLFCDLGMRRCAGATVNGSFGL